MQKMLPQDWLSRSKIELLSDERLEKAKIQLSIKRDDLIHPIISGNKFRKLKYNLQTFDPQMHQAVYSFGGAWSNHLHALAFSCSIMNIPVKAFVRSYKKERNATLDFCEKQGMELHFMHPNQYRKRDDLEFIRSLGLEDHLYIPEGGTNEFAVRGVAEMHSEINDHYDFVAVSCGSGGTAAGLLSVFGEKLKVYPALKNADYLRKKISSLGGKQLRENQWQDDYHFGGFAKANNELLEFTEDFYLRNRILADPIYTSKLFYGLFKDIEKGVFPEDSSILAIHTGGLQGWNGFLNKIADRPGLLRALKEREIPT